MAERQGFANVVAMAPSYDKARSTLDHREVPMKTTSRSNASAGAPDGGDGVLVTADWLAGHLLDPTVRVVEVDVSRAGYDQWHIDGAVLWNVYQDLKDSEYRLIDTAGLERLIARSGIGPESIVVFYGYAPAMGFWLMKLYGHVDVRILDSSRDAWRAHGHPWSNSAVQPANAGYVLGEADSGLRADHSAVRSAISESRITIADVRSEPEYRGERFWPSGGLEPNGRAGHVPSAVHQPIDGLYDQHGSFRPPADLRGVFSSIDLDGGGEVITYCTIGGRACTAWFVLSYLLGREHVRVYDGSWAEWGRMADTPVERS
jgi:thiosulfate/3-mercaptopyruvate sulfurtransferase